MVHLGWHVIRSSAEARGDAEVCDHQPAVVVKQQVRRLQVLNHDRYGMKLRQRLRNLDCELDSLWFLQPVFWRSREHIGEAFFVARHYKTYTSIFDCGAEELAHAGAMVGCQ